MDKDFDKDLFNCADKIASLEDKYYRAKLDLELLKADYLLRNDWENILNKSRPTVGEKDSYITQQTESRRRLIDNLKVELNYYKRIYEILIVSQKIRMEDK
jgi:hypothetical protein